MQVLRLDAALTPRRRLSLAGALGVRDVAHLGGRFHGSPILLTDPAERARLGGDDAREERRVREVLRRYDAAWPELPFDADGPLGLAVLLLGYEASVALDSLCPRRPHDPTLGDDVLLRVYRSGVRLSPRGPEAFFDGPGPPPDLAALLEAAPAWEAGPEKEASLSLRAPPGARARHVEAVERCLEHLFEGVLYQANPAHRLEATPRAFAEALRFFAARTERAEPPFAAFLDDARFGSLVSLSPKCFLEWDLEARRAVAIPHQGRPPSRPYPKGRPPPPRGAPREREGRRRARHDRRPSEE